MALQFSGLPVASLGSVGRLAASRHVFSGRLKCRPQYPRNLRGLLDEEEEVPYERLAQGKYVLNPAARPSTLADSNVRFSFQRLTVIAVFFLLLFFFLQRYFLLEKGILKYSKTQQDVSCLQNTV